MRKALPSIGGEHRHDKVPGTSADSPCQVCMGAWMRVRSSRNLVSASQNRISYTCRQLPTQAIRMICVKASRRVHICANIRMRSTGHTSHHPPQSQSLTLQAIVLRSGCNSFAHPSPEDIMKTAQVLPSSSMRAGKSSIYQCSSRPAMASGCRFQIRFKVIVPAWP